MGKLRGISAVGIGALTAVGLLVSGSVDAGTAKPSSSPAATVKSSIVNGATLSGQVPWRAEVSGIEPSPATIARVVFLIDHVERWIDRTPPYVFGGDGGVLNTDGLLIGLHTFAVRVYSRDGTAASDSVLARAVNGVTRLHSDFDQPGQFAPFDAFEHRGAFETGFPISRQLAWVTSPVRGSRRALRFTVNPGDKYGRSSGERALLRYTDQLSFEGADQYFAWSTFFPHDWAPPRWGLIFELHGDARFSLAPLRFNTRSNHMTLDMTTGACTDRSSCSYHHSFRLLSTLSKGRWNDFVVRIRFTKQRQGIIEVCHHLAGAKRWRMVLRLRNVPTLPYYPDQSDARLTFLWGIYTGAGESTRILYGDNFGFSTRLTDIADTFPRSPPTCRFTPG